MIGVLQGENGNLNNKYLEALRWILQHATWAVRFRKLKVSISHKKADFAASTL